MHRNRQNNSYRSYSYLPPSTSRNAHYQWYDPRLRSQQSSYSNLTPTARYTSPHLQQQYKPSTTISDLAEPISVFDDLKFPRNHGLDVSPFSSLYTPSNSIRRSSVSDARFATASAMREQLLINIQQSIHEIDQELSSLELRPDIPRYIPRYIPPRVSSVDKKIHSSKENKQTWTNKSKRVYEVLPRITSGAKKISRRSTPNVIKQSIPQILLGQYHYGPETEETEIAENDAENSELKAVVNELRESDIHKTLSLDLFYREQSTVPQNRALISVPEYVDDSENGLNETTEDFHQNNLIDTNIAQSSIVISSEDFISTSQLNIQDFEQLIQVAPEPKTKIPSLSEVKPEELAAESEVKPEELIVDSEVKPEELIDESEVKPEELAAESEVKPEELIVESEVKPEELAAESEPKPEELIVDSEVKPEELIVESEVKPEELAAESEVKPEELTAEREVKPEEPAAESEADLKNTILSKPIKHSHPLTRTEETHSPSQQALTNTKNNTPIDMPYFFSDFGNEGEGDGVEDLISIDSNRFIFPTGSEIISDDNISNILTKQSETSVIKPYSSQEQQQQQQQVTIQNNNDHVKERESKTTDATTKHIITSSSTLPAKKIVPTSFYDYEETHVERKKSDVNPNQRKILTTTSGMNATEQPPLNVSNNFSIQRKSFSPTSEQRTSSRSMTSSRQRSASSYQSSDNQSPSILSRNRSTTSVYMRKRSAEQTESILNNKQQTSLDSLRSSTLPVPLTSPDVNNMRPSTSRSTTPERRNSIPSLDLDILPASSDIIDFDNSSADDFLTSTERDPFRPSISFASLQENQLDDLQLDNQNRSLSLSPPIDEEETDRLKSVSPLTNETKTFEHDDLRLPSISPCQSDISDANLTSVDREETFRPPLSPDSNHDQLQIPASESKPIINDQLKHEDKHSLTVDDELPFITASQRRSKLSLVVRRPKPQSEKTINEQIHMVEPPPLNNDEKPQQRRRVFFSNTISHFPIEERNPLQNWRERIDHVLTKKHFPNDKYSHIKARVNSFANFEYQPKQIMILPVQQFHQNDTRKNNTNKRKSQWKQPLPPMKRPTPQLLGRLRRLPDGSPEIFHQTLEWNVQSKLKSYSFENFHYKRHRLDTAVSHEKPQWYNESRLSELVKDTSYGQFPMYTMSLPTISDIDVPNFHQYESETEMKIFDINFNSQQSISKFQGSFLNTASFNSRRSDRLIFDEKLVRTKKSKLRGLVRGNKNYQPEKPKVQIFHQPTHWNDQSKIRMTHSLTFDIQAKVNYWSESDLHQLTKTNALFSQHKTLQWNNIVRENILTQDYVTKNRNNHTQKKSPANRPKWNSVSKTRSVNSVYNPKVSNLNIIRRGWDHELRRKRVHKLPPLKRKRDHDDMPQLAIEAPRSTDPLTADYSYDHSGTAHDRTTSMDYATTPSRRSSRALVPLRRLPDVQLLPETPRSQRPVQQEWYDELSKSRLTHRTDMARTRNNSLQDSFSSVHRTNTPRELLTLRSSTRNSQNSVVSGTLLDSSIRSNRATELRLSKDMEEHHQHAHGPNQSLPFEIRGFRLEGTQLTVNDNTTIRPLSNVNYRASERVKNHRIYPWSHLHPHRSSSRNSSLVPITEFRHPSFETSMTEVPQLIREE